MTSAKLVIRRSGRALGPGGLASLVTRSEGNPLYVEELVAAPSRVSPAAARPAAPTRRDPLDAGDPGSHGWPQWAAAASTSRSCRTRLFSTTRRSRGAARDARRQRRDPRGDRFSFRHALLREAVHDDRASGGAGRDARRLRARPVREGRVRLDRASRWQYGASLAFHAAAAQDWPLALEASVWAGIAGKQYGSAAAADHFERALGPLGPGARCGHPNRARADRPPAPGRTCAGQRGSARPGARAAAPGRRPPRARRVTPSPPAASTPPSAPTGSRYRDS